MDILFKIMLFLHLAGLAVAASASVAMPFLGHQLATGLPAARPAFASVAGRIIFCSRIAFGILIASGLAMVFLRFNGDFIALGPWFHLKLALVLVIFCTMLISIFAPTAVKPQTIGMVMTLAMLGIIGSAVLAFN